MKNELIDPVTLTFNLSTPKPYIPFIGYPNVIPYIPMLNILGSFVFWVMLLNRQTNRRMQTFYPRRPTLSACVTNLRNDVYRYAEALYTCTDSGVTYLWNKNLSCRRETARRSILFRYDVMYKKRSIKLSNCHFTNYTCVFTFH